MAADIGKVFEREMTEVFKLLKEQYLVGWHRLTDTGAAGSVVSAQPSDYLLGLPPGSITGRDGQRMLFMEVKASEVHHKLGKAMVRPAQRGAVGTFRYMLDIPYFILFWDTQLGVLQLWDGIAVQGEKNMDKRHLLAQWADIGCINKLIRQRVVDHIVAHFHIPRSAVTLEKVRQSAH